MPADQKIIENHIDSVSRQVGAHRDLTVAGTALGSVDRHSDIAEELADDDNPEILHCQLDRVRLCARKLNIRPGKQE